jgi:prepilin-type N-terminal cleavage/methylation domain-containing protein
MKQYGQPRGRHSPEASNACEGEDMVRSYNTSRPRGGFSLIELVIVVVIIGIIAAIAIPRMSRGTAGAADSAVSGNLTILRNAVEMYASEHGGDFPTGTVAQVTDKLTMYTDVTGATSASRSSTHVYGPYLRKIPPVTVGTLKGKPSINNLFVLATTPEAAASQTGGWLYDTATGNVKVNLAASETDQNGKAYLEY